MDRILQTLLYYGVDEPSTYSGLYEERQVIYTNDYCTIYGAKLIDVTKDDEYIYIQVSEGGKIKYTYWTYEKYLNELKEDLHEKNNAEIMKEFLTRYAKLDDEQQSAIDEVFKNKFNLS